MSSPAPTATGSSPPSRLAIIAGFTTIYLVWGSTYLGIRIAVETLPPFLMSSARFLVAGGIIAAFIALTRGFRATRRQWRDNAIIGAFLLLGGNGLVSWAEEKVPSGIATLMVSVGPVFIVLLDWFAYNYFKDGKRGTRPNSLTFVGLAFGFIGLFLLVGPAVFSTGAGSLDGWRIAGLLVACFSWSVGSLFTRYAHEPAEAFTGAAIQMLCGGVWLLLVSVLTGEVFSFNPSAVSAHSLMAWAYLVVMGSLVGFTTFIWLMKHCSPARVATYAYVNPIVAVFLGWLILHEAVSPRIFLAAAVIIGGVAIITLSKNKKSPK